MYDMGKGVPQDHAEAFKWYKMAAEQGDARAQFNLGLMYDMGKGVPQDHAEAFKWYKMAAEQGIARAQHNLGAMYGKGQDVPKNYVMAHMWLNLAVSQGEIQAAEARSIIEKEMTPEQIAEAQRLSREFKVKNP
jgi:TPR repeat protein